MPTSSGRLGRRVLKEALSLPELPRIRRPGPRLLIYHQVGTAFGREMEVSVAVFSDQLAYLKTEGSIVRLDDALHQLGHAGDDRLFVLTFDDGYADVYENAFPLLRASRIPFTLYLTTNPIENATKPPADTTTGPRALTWDQIAEMHASGLATIGNHTHTHPDLRNIPARDISREVDTANRLIANRLGIQLNHFAYPKGWWSAPAEDVLRDRFASAVLGEGPAITAAEDPLRLHRIAVQKSDGMRYFKRKLSTGLVLEERLRRVVRRYNGPPSPL